MSNPVAPRLHGIEEKALFKDSQAGRMSHFCFPWAGKRTNLVAGRSGARVQHRGAQHTLVEPMAEQHEHAPESARVIHDGLPRTEHLALRQTGARRDARGLTVLVRHRAGLSGWLEEACGWTKAAWARSAARRAPGRAPAGGPALQHARDLEPCALAAVRELVPPPPGGRHAARAQARRRAPHLLVALDFFHLHARPACTSNRWP